jgi:hypothetical protein
VDLEVAEILALSVAKQHTLPKLFLLKRNLITSNASDASIAVKK